MGSSFAVDVEAGCNGNTIGGTTPDARNLLSGNGEIVYVTGSDNSVVQGNYINIDKDGVTPLQAALRGIDLTGASSGNLIGGSTTGAGNVSAHGLPTESFFQGSGGN